MPRKAIDMTGHIYGQWTVLTSARSNQYPCGTKRYYWTCECSCGVKKDVSGYSLRNGDSTSCGCTMAERNRVSAFKQFGIDPTKLDGPIHYKYFTKLKSASAVRGIEFDLTEKYVSDLYLAQDGKCAISKLPISFGKKLYGDDVTASLDRIDSDKPYTAGNVQWVHKDINWMKQDFPIDYFVKMCKIISAVN